MATAMLNRSSIYIYIYMYNSIVSYDAAMNYIVSSRMTLVYEFVSYDVESFEYDMLSHVVYVYTSSYIIAYYSISYYNKRCYVVSYHVILY